MSKLPHLQHSGTILNALVHEPSFTPNLSLVPLSHSGSPSLSFSYSSHHHMLPEDPLIFGTRGTVVSENTGSVLLWKFGSLMGNTGVYHTVFQMHGTCHEWEAWRAVGDSVLTGECPSQMEAP